MNSLMTEIMPQARPSIFLFFIESLAKIFFDLLLYN